MPRDFEAWITSWEQVITEGKEKKLGFAIQPSDWYSDFVNAVKQVLPEWVRIFEVTQVEKVENGTLSYRELANDCRREVKRFSTEKARVTKGSFGPSFAGESAVEEDAPGKGNISGRATAQGEEKKNRRRRQASEATTVCRGCGLRGHYHLQCFYLFPQKAPKYFKPRQDLQKAAEIALNEDSRLAEEVKQAQKKSKKDEKPFILKKAKEKSQTSQETTSESSS
jgi:hypothetical protein